MKAKTAFIGFYLCLLAASHVWVAWKGKDEMDPVLPNVKLSGEKSLFVYFRSAGGFDRDLETASSAYAAMRKGVFWAPDWETESSTSPNLAIGGLLGDFERVHVVGSGYGAAAALSFSQANRQKIENLSLVEPVLSYRFELLGDEQLNTALKAFQIAWFWILENGVPYFGYLDSLPYNYASAERAIEADLERAADIFERYPGSLRIYVENGGVVEKSGLLAAMAQVRPTYVVQKFEEVEGLDLEGLWVASDGIGGVDTVAPVKRFADLDPVSLEPWIAAGWLGLATFASEDLACIGAGLLASSGSISLLTGILGCLFGIFVGDLGIYFLGRTLGMSALELPILRRIAPRKTLDRSAKWFAEKGILIVVLTRFFPGSRVPTYFTAGVVGANWIRFTFALLVASAIWTPILVIAAYLLGDSFLHLFESLGTSAWLGIVLFFVIFIVGTRLFAGMLTWRGRRLLYSHWKRATNWEFWPMWAVYAPVSLYLVWLALRFRSLSLPFSANPCMPASGLVYESKIQILKHLEAYGVPVARFSVIELELSLEAKKARVAGFMERLGLGYPVVLKPDVGQRGQGVLIARDESDALRFFAEQEEDAIVQEYVSGPEFGVFYERAICEEKGRVNSITEKRLLSVRGDGRSDLETLILKDSRAVCMAKYFLNEYESDLRRVLNAGEEFKLSVIGTHCRGAIFLDGQEYGTAEMVAAVDAFSRNVEGFHIGRYDLRVPSLEDFKKGEGLRILELNGITSEPTHMYDPKHSAFFGWRCLMRHWKAVFEVAKENRLAGHEPVSKWYVIRLAWAHSRGSSSRDLS